MPSSKGRGHGKDSPQKKAAARRLHTTRSSTKSNKQRGIEEDQYDTLAALPSRKSKPSLKKLTLPSESTTSPKKQDPSPVNLPGSKSGIVVPQAVTLQKRDQASGEESSNDGNSTGDASSNDGNSTGDASTGNSTGNENASTGNSSGISTGNGSASATMTTQFDAKLEHVLTHYLSATGADHHIRKAFIHEKILTFDKFTDGCTVENIKTFQQDDGNNNLVQAFSSLKLTLVTNVILYDDFLQDDSQEALAEDPVNWVKADFRKWRQNPPVNTTTNAGAATVTTVATTAAAKQKEENDSFSSWRRSRQDEKDYPVLDNDREFIEWKVKFERKIHSNEMY